MSKQSSLYRYTKESSYYLGYYSPIQIPKDETDYVLTIEPKYHHKPGRLALDLYNDERLGWIFRYFNNDVINDPIFDLEAGMKIRVPTAEKVLKYI